MPVRLTGRNREVAALMNSNSKRLLAACVPRSSVNISIVMVWLCTGLFLTISALHWLRIVSWEQSLGVLGVSRGGVFDRLWLFQVLTAPLMHASLTHLVFNMLTLWMLGPGVETALGGRRYIVFSILCGWVSLAGFLLFSRSNWQVGVGYSGVIFGILTAQAIYHPDHRVVLFAVFPLRMRRAAFLLGTIELYMTLNAGRASAANAAHLFGAVAAFGFIMLIRYRDSRERVQRHGATFVKRKKRCFRNDIPREL